MDRGMPGVPFMTRAIYPRALLVPAVGALTFGRT
jgi:hypothetical protein